MREHMAKAIGIGVVAAVVGALCGAGLGRADAGSAHRYADAAQDARTRDLEARLADAIKERDRLRQDNEAMQAQLRASAPAVDLGGAMSRLQDELTNLRGELESARDQAQAALARTEQELAAAKTALAGAQRAAEQQATAARQSAEREAARWRQQAETAQAQVEPLRREVADLRQQIVTLNETIKTLKMFGGGR
jgi:chromosome segregation ATPase